MRRYIVKAAVGNSVQNLELEIYQRTPWPILKREAERGSGMMQRRNDRNVRGEPRRLGNVNLRRMGCTVRPEGAESSWEMRICMNTLAF